MVTVCLKCGFKGYAENLVYCEKCQDYAMHWYCLDVPPTSFDQFVSWFCEDCEPQVENTSSLDKANSVQSSSSMLLESKEMQANKSREREKNGMDASEFAAEKGVHICEGNRTLHKIHVRNYDKKFTEDLRLDVKDKGAESVWTKDRILVVKEKKPESVSTKKRRLLAKESEAESVHTKEWRHLVKEKEAESVQTKERRHLVKEKETESVHTKERRLLVKEKEAESVQTKEQRHFVKEKEAESIQTKEQRHLVKEKEAESVQTKDQRLLVKEKEAESAQTKDRRLVKVASQIVVSGLTTSSTKGDYCDVQPQPIIYPIWRGRLRMRSDFKTVDWLAVVAHLSTLACSRVQETSKLLPELLSLELTCMSYVWPKSFENYGPNQHDIGLYFFPENIRDEIIFDDLVDKMIRENLAMRAVFEYAELLIFASKILPMRHWRFQTKFYLWGVFKKKQDSRPAGSVDPRCEKSIDLASYRLSPISPLSSTVSSPLSSTVSYGL